MEYISVLGWHSGPSCFIISLQFEGAWSQLAKGTAWVYLSAFSLPGCLTVCWWHDRHLAAKPLYLGWPETGKLLSPLRQWVAHWFQVLSLAKTDTCRDTQRYACAHTHAHTHMHTQRVPLLLTASYHYLSLSLFWGKRWWTYYMDLSQRHRQIHTYCQYTHTHTHSPI